MTGEANPLEMCLQSAAVAECQASVLGNLIGAPVLLATGTVGNLWIAFVAARCSLRKSPTAAFMLAQALMDTLALWTGLTRHFYMSLTGIDVREISPLSCKFQRFTLYVAMDASATVLAAISVDRFAAVWLPHKRKLFSLSKGRAVVVALTAASVLFNLHIFWTRGEQAITEVLSNRTSVRNCGYPRPEYASFWKRYQGWLGMAYFCVLPFAVMVVLNTLTVFKLRAQRRARRCVGSEKQSRLTSMLLIASMFFVCVTAPAFLYNNIEAMNDFSKLDEAARQRLWATDTYVTLLQYANHAVNFYLYVLTGRGFRRDVRASVSDLRGLGASSTAIGRGPLHDRAVKATITTVTLSHPSVDSFSNASCSTSVAALSPEIN